MKTPIIAVILTACLLALGGEISEYNSQTVRYKSGDFRKSRSPDEMDSRDHGITEIGIERGPCFGTCPIYTFVAKADGTIRYKGVRYVEHEGEFTGTIPDRRFHRLAQFIRDSGYMELEDEYLDPRMIRDASRTFTMVIMNGKRKTVRNDGSAGPSKLWAIEELIDSMLAEIKWDSPQRKPEKEK